MVSKKSFKLLVAARTTPFFAVVQIIYFLDCSCYLNLDEKLSYKEIRNLKLENPSETICVGQIIALQQDFKTSAYQSIFTELWLHDEEEFRIQNISTLNIKIEIHLYIILSFILALKIYHKTLYTPCLFCPFISNNIYFFERDCVHDCRFL